MGKSAHRLMLRPNLGDVNNLQLANMAGTAAEATISILVMLGTVTGPVGAAIAGIVAVGLGIASFFKGCGQTCVQTSNWANQAEPLLQQNVQHYLNSPVRYRSMQAAALNNFDTVWKALTAACGQPALGPAGQRCISDRQAGACKWQTDGQGGPAGSGSVCWNWFIGYRDPIANDPGVQDDPVAAAPASDTSAGGGGTTQTVVQNPDGTVSVINTPASTGLPPIFVLGALGLGVLLLMEMTS